MCSYALEGERRRGVPARPLRRGVRVIGLGPCGRNLLATEARAPAVSRQKLECRRPRNFLAPKTYGRVRLGRLSPQTPPASIIRPPVGRVSLSYPRSEDISFLLSG